MSRPGAALLFALGALGACRAPPSTGPYAPPGEVARSTTRAEVLTRQAAERIRSEPEEAEALLRQALAADLFFGPAHNNLGVLFLAQGKLYEAASEFEWARKLMPGHPDPRLNLAITLERAGKTDDALASYSAALEVYPDYLPAIQGLASLSLRAGREEPRLEDWLRSIALRSGEPEWGDWARRQLSRAR